MDEIGTYYDDNPKRQDEEEFEEGLVFVGMAFYDEMNDVYSAIKDECNNLELEAVRVDENVGSRFIIHDIIELIEDSEFLIFDLTHERQNVYYELGYAHGVGNLGDYILLIAKKGTNIHFDVAPMRIQFYESTEHLRKIVNQNLEKMIEIAEQK